MRIFLILFCLCLAGWATAQQESLLKALRVPVDYSQPGAAEIEIRYELGAPYHPGKPTVFIIADAQQFYVRKGRISALQEQLFDSSFNVVGIIGRNQQEGLRKSMAGPGGEVDWEKAYRFFSWTQYVQDINQVRRHLLGDEGRVMLYGQSGGGLLVHQYLSIFGKYVTRAFTGAALNYQLDAESGINHDRFWEEATGANPALEQGLQKILKGGRLPRELLAMLFQRQHFFVKSDSLPFYRQQLAALIEKNDTAGLRSYRQQYQVDAILDFYQTDQGIPIRVRLFEFIFPLLSSFRVLPDTLQPDLENLYYSSRPLVRLYHAEKISPRLMEFSALPHTGTRVFILAGRYDHTADYRSQIALAGRYPRHILFIADDNHTFSRLKESGKYRKMLCSFFRTDHAEFQVLLKEEFDIFRWRE